VDTIVGGQEIRAVSMCILLELDRQPQKYHHETTDNIKVA
jgi:hypothetical protein